MVITTHFLVGSAVGFATQDPILGFLAGFASHHLIDPIPHVDSGSYGVNVKNILNSPSQLAFVLIDGVLAFTFFIYFGLIFYWYLPILIGGIAGVLPDLIDNVPFWSIKLRKIFPFSYYHLFHEKFHFTIMDKRYLWIGYLTQAILIFLSLQILL